MSCNSMISGYAIKLKNRLTEEEREEIYENVDYEEPSDIIRKFPADNCDYLAIVEDFEYDYVCDSSCCCTIGDLKHVDKQIKEYAVENDIDIDGDAAFFFKVWYNGCDMGDLF